MIDHHADVSKGDSLGQRPAHYAASNGQLRALEMLVKAGADLNDVDENARTPLVLLAEVFEGVWVIKKRMRMREYERLEREERERVKVKERY